MTRPEAHLLSAYRPPTGYPVSLDPAEATAWLAGYFALWHPAVLARVGGPPRVSSAYDHDQPGDGFVYAVPQEPGLHLPGDWAERVAAAGGVTFPATADRTATLAALGDALGGLPPVADEVVRAFAGVGYGYLIVDTLFDAASHDRLLDADGFWADVSAAATADDPFPLLKAAAEKLKDARERLNTSGLCLLDLITTDTAEWPVAVRAGLPATLIATGEQLRALPAARRAALTAVEIAVAADAERADDLLPVESQRRNLYAARRTARELFGVEVATAAWLRATVHPQTPGMLLHAGYKRAVLLGLNGERLPTRGSAVVTWPGLDGKSVEAFARTPKPADDPNTFFNLPLTVHDAFTSDHRPAAAFLHRGGPPAVGYAELVALARLAPAAGEFVTVSQYMDLPHYGDYLGTATADEYFADHLVAGGVDPVSRVASHHRRRREYDTATTLAALYRSLTPERPGDHVAELLAAEAAVEAGGGYDPAGWAKTLADRIQAGAAPDRPGWLVFNPCGFARRVGLELADVPHPIPAGEAVKAAEWADGTARLVVEVPGLGFAWLPRGGPPGTPAPAARIRTAEGTLVRNEFFEAELDPATGGLRGFRDTRTRANRLGLQLVGGARCRATSVRVTHAGAALGEVTAEGELLSEEGRRVATFRHRLRAWVGRPALEVRIEFDHVEPPTGSPWDNYYGARLGWRDERAAVLRGCQGATVAVREDHIHAPDFLEVRLGGERTFVFPGGLPFVRKSGPRTADLVLIPPGETGRRFELLLALDRDVPMQTAQGWVTPAPVVATEKGPPGAASGWLGHVDLPSLMLTSLRPEPTGQGATARLTETSGFGGTAELRFARPPAAASLVDGEGAETGPLAVTGGAVGLEFSAHETLRVRATW